MIGDSSPSDQQTVGGAALGFGPLGAWLTAILAVVAVLALVGASAVSHDLYANILCRGNADEKREVMISKIATLCLDVLAVLMGIAFRSQNIAYLVSLSIIVATSTNFPPLLAICWRGLTTRGAVLGGVVGLVSSVAMTGLGPAVWVRALGYAEPIIPLDPPTLVTMPLAFAICIGVSLLDRSAQARRDQADYDAQQGKVVGCLPPGVVPAY